MSLHIRELHSAEEKGEGFALFRSAMLGLPEPDPGTVARYLAGSRGFGTYEDDRLLGTVNGYDSEIFLPGGARVRHLAVTHVGVAPEATRRGIARELLVHQLRVARAEGYAVAGLRASDARLYGRYGYGIASFSVREELDLRAARPLRAGITTHRVDPRDFALFRAIADRQEGARPATLCRWDGWWAMQEARARHASTPQHAVVVGPSGGERGLLRFHVEPTANWFTAPRRGIVVDDLIAQDAEAWRALIGHLFAQDILHHAIFPSRPVDDPLWLLLDNPRAVSVSDRRDESWIRILDMHAFLAALPEGPEVWIAIRDPLFSDNDGTWKIGSMPEKSIHPAHAEILVSDFVSLAFGAVSTDELEAAGRIHLTSPDARQKLRSIFGTGPRPHSGISF